MGEKEKPYLPHAVTVMDICRENKWDFIIRYKTGSFPNIMDEYERIPEKEKTGRAEYGNEIDYNGNLVNMLRFREEESLSDGADSGHGKAAVRMVLFKEKWD